MLIIEDEQHLSNVVKKGLIEEGFAVDQAFDGEEGLYLAESESYDLIILDLMLPKIEGIEVCRQLRNKKIKTPILMLTAKTRVEEKVAGVVAAADPIKPTAKTAIEKMKELGLEVAMITGDNKKTAEAIGKQLGIERIFAEVLPEEKEKYVKKLQEEGKFVAMVGDGVNDAPALAQSDIGIAIGAGTDVAIETANVVLMKSDPVDILRAIRLSKATVRKMKENLVWASVYNILAIPVAAGILYPKFGITLRPEFSALLMSISSIIVAVNAVLLKRAEKDLITI
ncbi:MAG: HAD-IC family P-type ATPase [Patescibacteria group bacterium]